MMLIIMINILFFILLYEEMTTYITSYVKQSFTYSLISYLHGCVGLRLYVGVRSLVSVLYVTFK